MKRLVWPLFWVLLLLCATSARANDPGLATGPLPAIKLANGGVFNDEYVALLCKTAAYHDQSLFKN